jgi:hypothetical protein
MGTIMLAEALAVAVDCADALIEKPAITTEAIASDLMMFFITDCFCFFLFYAFYNTISVPKT